MRTILKIVREPSFIQVHMRQIPWRAPTQKRIWIFVNIKTRASALQRSPAMQER